VTPTCPNHQQLSSFHDGELSSVETSRCREHLKSCPVCRDVVSRFAQLDKLVTSAQMPCPVKREASFWQKSLAFVATVGIAVGLLTYFREPPPASQAKVYKFTAQGEDYVISVKGDAYLVSMQMGDTTTTYDQP